MFSRPYSAQLALLSALALPPALRADTLTGRVVDSSGNGIAGVTLDFSNGFQPANPVTDPNGFFTIVLPSGTYDIAFLPSTVAFAPRELTDVTIAGTLNLGNVVLRAGHALSGLVTTTAGQPVQDSDINVYEEATGNKLFTPGDNTDVNGRFSVIVPAGTYRVRASTPPLAVLVAEQIRGVTVSGPTNVGTIRLRPGLVVTGRVIDAVTGAPLAEVDLDADDALSGEQIVTPGDNTDATGRFRLILPFGLFHLSFDPPQGMPNVARQLYNVFVLATMQIPDTRLQGGVALSGAVTAPGGVPVPGADIDVSDPNGNELYLANDNTDGSGAFSVVVPAGSWIVEVEPDPADGLVGSRTSLPPISTPTALPAIQLAPGVVLSGTITGPGGAPEADADLDLVDPVTGAQAVTPGDFTDGNGNFAAVVPPGTWDVHINTAGTSRAAGEVVAGLSITGNTSLNRQLGLSAMDVMLTPFGVQVLPQGGSLLLQTVTFRNQTVAALTTQAEIAVRAADGNEIAVIPPIPLTLPPGVPLTLSGLFVPVPVVPASWTGVELRYVVRFRDPVTGQTQDSDSARFVVR